MSEVVSASTVLESASGKRIEVRYAIMAEHEPAGNFECERYGIKVETDEGEQETVLDITTSRTRIQELFALLHRNGVTPISVRDVIQDWL